MVKFLRMLRVQGVFLQSPLLFGLSQQSNT